MHRFDEDNSLRCHRKAPSLCLQIQNLSTNQVAENLISVELVEQVQWSGSRGNRVIVHTGRQQSAAVVVVCHTFSTRVKCTRYSCQVYEVRVGGRRTTKPITADQGLRCCRLTHIAPGGNYGSILFHHQCCHNLRL